MEITPTSLFDAATSAYDNHRILDCHQVLWDSSRGSMATSSYYRFGRYDGYTFHQVIEPQEKSVVHSI